MKLREHVVIAGTASLGLFTVLGAKSFLFGLASVIIDSDHYLEFLYQNGFSDFSVKRMFVYHDILNNWWHRPGFLNLSIFHTVEFQLSIYFISIWLDSFLLLIAFWGMLFHLLLDSLYLYKKGALFKRAFSFIDYAIRKRIMSRQGLSPITFCKDALILIHNHEEENGPSAEIIDE